MNTLNGSGNHTQTASANGTKPPNTGNSHADGHDASAAPIPDFAIEALQYARVGFHSLPLVPKGKLPAISKKDGGNGFHDATTDEKVIREWGRKYPQGNIGIRTGAESGIIVVDIDPRNGGDKTIAKLAAEGCTLPEDSARARSGNGGLHYYFKHEPGIPCSANKLGPGIDIRSDGGYIVAPPSVIGPDSKKGTAGGSYQWLVSHFDVPPQPMPAWLRERLIKRDAPPPPEGEVGNGKADPGKTPPHDLEVMLNCISSSEYDTWWQTGEDLCHALGDAGRPPWDRWSAGSTEKFSLEAQAAKWAYFLRSAPSKPIRLKRIFARAFAKGFRPDATSSPEVQHLDFLRLAELAPIEYDRERAGAAARLGIRVGTLDDKVEELRPKPADTDTDEDAASIFPEIEPWPEPVYLAELLTAIVAMLALFVVLPLGAPETIALWIILSHAHDAFDHSPILAILSPEKRCGKTLLLNIITQVVLKALQASNITTAALFRSISKYNPTLILDEVETFIKENEEMRGVLNSGFTKASAFVIRTVGENFDPHPFSTWCAKVVALIGKLPDTLQDRSIPLALNRKSAKEKVERFNGKHHTALHELRAKAARWASDHLEELRGADPAMPPGLNDRAQDCWRPLLAIADLADAEWSKSAREAALRLNGERQDDDGVSAGVMLLTHIREVFMATGTTELSSTDLAASLCETEHWPWGEWRRGQSITTRGVAYILKRFSIKPQSRQKFNAYVKADFEDAWTRYLSDTPSTPSDPPCAPTEDTI